MMLCKLSLKNIKKSFKDYAIYFFTLILGVAIFYVFNAIESQTVLLDATSNTTSIILLMTNMLSGVSIFVSFILGFLIIYASRFLIKRRNKEFGVYLTLGMSKRKISLILFFETLFIGIISLAIGLIVGVALSQLMSLLVANMFEADMTKFAFIFSESAFIKTLIYFGIMYLLVMIFNTFNVSKCKLIDLLYASKKEEKIKLKNPIICTIIFIISTIILGYAYYMVTSGVEMIDTVDKIFIPISMGAISTFFIFWSVSGLLLKIFMSLKRTYYKGLNSFTLRQFSSKINTTVFSMTIICLMLFITICVLSSCLSLKDSLTRNLNELAPMDAQIYKKLNISGDFDSKLIEDSKISARDTLEKHGFNLEENFKDIMEFNIYKDDNITFGYSLGNDFEAIKEEYKFMHYDNVEDIMRISEYNKVAKNYGNETYTLNDNEYMIIADYQSMVQVRNIALKDNMPLTINGKTYYPKYQECKDGFVELSSQHINSGIILVPDNAVTKDMVDADFIVANYKANSKDGRQEIENELMATVENVFDKESFLYINTKIDITEASVGLGALVTFIGLYLGIIFLISSAAILALKELSESTDNIERFKMLRRLGADEKMINKVLFRQIGIFFAFPLLLAVIHAIFGIKFCTILLEGLGTDGLLPSIIMTFTFLIIIYGGYFLLTYLCSKNIIKEKY